VGGSFVSGTVAKTRSSCGRTIHFCSDACLKQYLEQPKQA